jgi:hypothetical protein
MEMKKEIRIMCSGDMADAFVFALVSELSTRHRVDLLVFTDIDLSQASERLAITEGVTEIDSKRVTRQNIVDALDMLKNASGFDRQLSSPEELIMEIHAMPQMEPIVLKDEKPLSNMGAYRGYKSHPTKASDRKRFERFNKKRR